MSGIFGNVLDTVRQGLYAMRMKRLFSSVLLALLLLVFVAGCAAKHSSSRSESAGQEIVDSSVEELRSHLEGPQMKDVAAAISQAKGIMIVPGLGDVSFFFSVGGGNALLMAKTEKGWSGPAFLTKGAAGFGVQAGFTKTSGLIIYMHEDDMRYVVETGGIAQGQAAVTVLESDWATRTPSFAGSGDIVFVGDTSGLYAGVGVDAGGLSDRPSINAAYHGVEDGSPENVLYNTATIPEGARELRELLESAEEVAGKAQINE